MSSESTKTPCSLPAGILILWCALAMLISGCSKSSEPRKVPEPQKAPVTQKAPEPQFIPDVKLAQKYAGKYLNKKYPDDFTELKKDGTFLYKEGNSRLAGKFAIQGNRILLALPDGSGSFSNIDDSGLTDDIGNLWTRK